MKNRPCSLAIFDMDGLMLDTERIGWEAWQEVLAGYARTMDFSDYSRVIGTNQSYVRAETLRIYGDDFPVDEFLTAVWARRMELAFDQKVPTKPGLTELLAFLKERGIPCAVATSSDRRSMEQLLRAAGIWDSFSVTACGDEVTHSKPHPEIFLTAAQKAGVLPAQAVVLEDSPNGIRAAHAAGMTGVFVRDLIDLPSDAAAMAAAQLRSLHQVIDWLS